MSDDSAFGSLLKQINKRYGTTTIVAASDNAALNARPRIPTGIPAFDWAIGGGVPTGSIMTLLGEFSSGKSILSLQIAGAFNRVCRNCGKPLAVIDPVTRKEERIRCCAKPARMNICWFDAEGSFQNSWAVAQGVSLENMFVIRTEFAEQGIDIADALLRSGECDLLVVDSVAQLTPSVEIEESSEKWQMGTHARLMNKAMRKWASAQNAGSLERAFSPTILLINQIRHKIGVIYGSPETSPGGKGIDFASHVIVRCKRKSWVEDSMKRPVGHEMEVVFKKNKTAPPNRTAGFTFYFNGHDSRVAGSSNVSEQIVKQAEFWGLIKRTGAWYQLAKDIKAQGSAGAAQKLDETPRLRDMLLKKISERENAWLNET
jgi:recombination protein RecA